MRSPEEIKKIVDTVDEAFSVEFGRRLNPALFAQVFKDLTAERLKKFLLKRVGHLPDADFLSFIEAVNGKKGS